MSLVLTAVAAIAGFSIATAIQKGRNKELEEILSQQESKKQLAVERSTKPEHEKDVLDIIQDIAYGRELDHFTLVEINSGKSKYQYFKNDVLITVLVEEDYIECQVKRKGTPVVEYIFDKDWDTYDKQTIVRSVYESIGHQKAMEIIEDFMFEVNNHDWQVPDSNVQIIDDVKETRPITTSYPVDGLTTLDQMEQTIKEQEINDEVGQAILDVIEKIKDATKGIEMLDKELDIEAKHVYDELVKKDLSKLFHAYLKLDEENRLAYKTKILDGLDRIENKTSELLVQVKNKNLHEIDSILHVIKQRYKE